MEGQLKLRLQSLSFGGTAFLPQTLIFLISMSLMLDTSNHEFSQFVIFKVTPLGCTDIGIRKFFLLEKGPQRSLKV